MTSGHPLRAAAGREPDDSARDSPNQAHTRSALLHRVLSTPCRALARASQSPPARLASRLPYGLRPAGSDHSLTRTTSITTLPTHPAIHGRTAAAHMAQRPHVPAGKRLRQRYPAVTGIAAADRRYPV